MKVSFVDIGVENSGVLVSFFSEDEGLLIDEKSQNDKEIKKLYEKLRKSSKKNKIDAAVRYSTVYDDYDIGIAHFYGNNRSPELNVNPLSQKLDAYYPILSQTSLDIQSTKGAWLYKLETLTAKNGEERHFGIAGGTEYTIYGLRETTSDLGIIV